MVKTNRDNFLDDHGGHMYSWYQVLIGKTTESRRKKKKRETAEYSLRDGWISKPVKLAGISLSFVGGGFTDNIPRAGLILWFRELCEWQNKNDIRVSDSHFSAEFIFMSSSQTTSIQNWSQIICRSETTDTFGVCGCSLLAVFVSEGIKTTVVVLQFFILHFLPTLAFQIPLLFYLFSWKKQKT